MALRTLPAALTSDFPATVLCHAAVWTPMVGEMAVLLCGTVFGAACTVTRAVFLYDSIVPRQEYEAVDANDCV